MSADWELASFYHTVVNVSDLDRSIAFYKTLGFEVLDDRRHVKWPKHLATQFGLRHAQARGVLMVIPNDPQGPMIDLLEWIEPTPSRDPSVPEDLRIPQIIALRTRNVRQAYEDLQKRGIRFTSEFNGPFDKTGVLGVVCCKDPDGTVIELIELEPGVRHSRAKLLREAG